MHSSAQDRGWSMRTHTMHWESGILESLCQRRRLRSLKQKCSTALAPGGEEDCRLKASSSSKSKYSSALQPHNLLHMHDEREPTGSEQAELGHQKCQNHIYLLCAGDRVTLSGLNRIEMNEIQGMMVSYDCQSGRYIVCL
mmetsp:Transcript_85709/g.148123  ORF Transcript_85709/g.148123 Transcript_85709/m.148123 type:complete len:140 (-) Transcript_85709:154-573(-)